MGTHSNSDICETRSTFSEYRAWLQSGNLRAAHPMKLSVGEGVSETAARECAEGLERLYGKGILSPDAEYSIALEHDGGMSDESYRLSVDSGGVRITGGKSGLLYGVFAFLLCLGEGRAVEEIAGLNAPAASLRVLNHWDNADGSVERGYAGKSLFFKGGRLCYDDGRIRDYARLLASTGINVVVPNNVNVGGDSARLISDEMLPEVARLAAIFRPYGIRLGLSVHFESPKLLGGLANSDPLEPAVADWWQSRADAVYREIPDFSGYLVKADSEFQGGPGSAGRTQADGANTLARTLKPYGGLIFWRCFIYNCAQDWRDLTVDRPKAAYQLFMPMDGLFDDNVILQVKNGPSDFQVREPNSPLLGAMKHTPQALELQITQEYTGQQRDVYNLAAQWEEVYSGKTPEGSGLRDMVGGKIAAVAGVANTGLDGNWTGHTLAQLNLFAFGCLAWNPKLTALEITRRWVRLTFGEAPQAELTDMLMRSRGVYESYTTPLGLNWMVNVGHHYGPSPEGYEYMRWGTYHRADTKAVGVDRTSRGTGFSEQYSPDLAVIYDSTDTCPEELLLFFHRLPYDFRLKSGVPLLQYIYDTHFKGAEDVEGFLRIWESLRDKLPGEAYKSVRTRLEWQLANALEWRDVINTYFYRKTGVGDAKGRKIYM